MRITATGNEGFWIEAGNVHLWVDAFFRSAYGFGEPRFQPDAVERADVILVTHAHWDHFDPGLVAAVAERGSGHVVGPPSVISALGRKMAADRLVVADPPVAADGETAASTTVQLPLATVTAFRTFHGREHNSYLVEVGGQRFLHDGDNEDTRRLDVARIGPLDGLMIAPWYGSDWVRFIENVRPRHWFMMHLSEHELNEHEAGRYLPALCDHVPPGLVVLRPGQEFPLA